MSEAQEESVRPYQLPDIPDSLVTPDVRSEYLIAHYWDNFDIENRAYLDARKFGTGFRRFYLYYAYRFTREHIEIY